MTDYEIYALQSYNDHIIEDKRPNKNSCVEDLNQEQLKNYIEKVKRDKPNFAKNDFKKCLKLCGITDNTGDRIFPTLAGTLILENILRAFIHSYLLHVL